MHTGAHGSVYRYAPGTGNYACTHRTTTAAAAATLRELYRAGTDTLLRSKFARVILAR